MHSAVIPFAKIGKRIEEIAEIHGFMLREFHVTPNMADPDGSTQATAVFELIDPDKEPDVMIVRVNQGMNEAAEAAWREEQNKKADVARKELEGEIDDKKMRGRGAGFL